MLGLWPDTDSELSASEGTTAKNLQGIKNKIQYFLFALRDYRNEMKMAGRVKVRNVVATRSSDKLRVTLGN